jgi:hypothetical protein
MGSGSGRRPALKGALLALALVIAAPAQSQPIVEPAPSSPLRKAVLDGLRAPVEKRLGRGLEFKVTVIRVQGEWAFVIVDPQRKGGRPIDGYRIFGEHFDNMDGLRIEAVLRKRGGRWAVVDHGIGATDVWYCDVGPRSLKRDWGC